jgi:SynChlorMet cassette protein ScmD
MSRFVDITRPGYPIANPVVVLREEFDDWAVLFNPDTADAVGINPVGVAVWKRIDGKRTLGEIVAQINDIYDDVPGAALEEITAFVDKLSENGFVGYELKNGC